jgi:CheY-like chemotaxis protein
LTTEGKVGLSFLVDAATPQDAAEEVLARNEGHGFPTLEIWEGSTCLLSLDGVKVQSSPTNPMQSTAQSTDARKVLVVDDDPSIRLFVAQLLRDQGYYVYESGSGQGALDLVARGIEIEVLVTDVRMPDMSGFTLASRVAETHGSIKVLYTTAFTLKPAETRLQRPGSEILKKPFQPTQLAAAVKRVLEG